jgi:hypothetical protein
VKVGRREEGQESLVHSNFSSRINVFELMNQLLSSWGKLLLLLFEVIPPYSLNINFSLSLSFFSHRSTSTSFSSHLSIPHSPACLWVNQTNHGDFARKIL